MRCLRSVRKAAAAPACEGGACRLRSLFWSFLKIGAFTFGGGYAMIPLIKSEVVDRRRWVEQDHFLELLVLAQSAPGPISLNAAVFVGYRARGIKGALSALAGVVLPSFFIILAVAVYFSSIRDNRVAAAALEGMRPAVVALILAPLWSLAKGMGAWRIAMAVAACLAVWYFGLTPIYFIIAGALGGMAWTWYKTLGR